MQECYNEKRPWGHFVVVYGGDGCVVKALCVKRGHRLSDQRHHHRSERWFVHTGHAILELEYPDGRKEINELAPGMSIEFGPLTWHRLAVPHDAPEDVYITEVWMGKKLNENDIERRSDDYGRI